MANRKTSLCALSAEENTPQAEIVRGLIRDRLAQRKGGKIAFEIAKEMGVVGIDGDPRRNVANRHSKYVKAAMRGKRSA